MKLFILVISILILLAGAFFVAKKSYENMPLSVLMSSDLSTLAEESRQFMEALQFKDFKGASALSMPEHLKTYDMPMLIERLFQVKPEFLDIQKNKILSVEKDTTNKRAKVNIESEVKILNTNELKKPNVILYWKKMDDGKWYLDLASSIK